MVNFKTVSSVLTNFKNVWHPQTQPVRYRLWSERKDYISRYGYVDNFNPKGLLPRDSNAPIREMKQYRPRNKWSERRAFFGQNDYIDILGDTAIHPTKIQYHIPTWLRGFHGNEFQILLRKIDVFRHGNFRYAQPKKWKQMKFRINHLFKILNYRRRIGQTSKYG